MRSARQSGVLPHIWCRSPKEYDEGNGNARLVVAVSTDTGMNFTHHVSFTADELAKQGAQAFGEEAIFSSSQCLFEDRTAMSISTFSYRRAAIHTMLACQ
ncbi:hypothetical protein [Mesorhizobium sp. M0435]|uniref:hypothetical protein n=1 Tax=Mesorhizobium sp. M0435 TaxID=2956944 RepID=UPI00333CD07A